METHLPFPGKEILGQQCPSWQALHPQRHTLSNHFYPFLFPCCSSAIEDFQLSIESSHFLCGHAFWGSRFHWLQMKGDCGWLGSGITALETNRITHHSAADPEHVPNCAFTSPPLLKAGLLEIPINDKDEVSFGKVAAIPECRLAQLETVLGLVIEGGIPGPLYTCVPTSQPLKEARNAHVNPHPSAHFWNAPEKEGGGLPSRTI